MSERRDPELIHACLDGDGRAWEVLVNRYKRLVYSIPFKYGLSREEAQEVFQAVWLDCFQELHLLRDLERLQAWLVRIAVRKCFRIRQKYRTDPTTVDLIETDALTDDPSGELVERMDREQMIRTGIAQLSPRCQQVVQALFFEDPFPSYATIANRLGLSPNSIGFTRDRCLERLGKLLQGLGYEHG
jgi:RNA polymerase sigma factor (sigma-70 family)